MKNSSIHGLTRAAVALAGVVLLHGGCIDDGFDDEGGILAEPVYLTDEVERIDGGVVLLSGGDVPDTAHCASVADWPEARVAFEEQVLTLVNQARAVGGNCGSQGSFGPSAPLQANPALRCAVRLHSADMAANAYFSHTSLDGRSPFDRMRDAGYNYSWAGENIAAGYSTPSAVVNAWLSSPGHCANILRSQYRHLGVGYAQGGPYGHYWTQNFGAQR